MKRILTTTAVLNALISLAQITTQTLNTSTMTTSSNQTITTYTVLTTNSVLVNANMFDFALNWNTATPNTSTNTAGILTIGSGMAPNDWYKLSKNLSTGAFDSLR